MANHIKETFFYSLRLQKIAVKGNIIKNGKDITQVAIHGTSEPHDLLPGMEGDSDNQKVPPSIISTFIYSKTSQSKENTDCSPESEELVYNINSAPERKSYLLLVIEDGAMFIRMVFKTFPGCAKLLIICPNNQSSPSINPCIR